VQQTIAACLERFPTPTLLLVAADEHICRTITSVGLQVRAGAPACLWSLCVPDQHVSLSVKEAWPVERDRS